MLTHDVNNLADVTNAILQPEPRDGLETGLHVYPNLAANIVNISSPNAGGIVAMPVIANFANPMEFLCSSIQAGSRLGYQESAELCAQYLGPILDSIKFNYLPFGANQLQTAMTLPKQIAYSEQRLQPPPGYKDTTVPGIFSRDTLFSHGNHEPGWIVAPGMQGVEVQPFTQEHADAGVAGRTDGWPRHRRRRRRRRRSAPRATATCPARRTRSTENNPLPPPWYPQPGPPPAPAPGVVPGDPLGAIAPAAPARPPAAPAGPPLPAEAGG